MGTTIKQIGEMLSAMDLKFKELPDDRIGLLFGMRHYRTADGDDGLHIVIELLEEGRYFNLFAPLALKAEGPHVDAFLKACMIVQWRTKLIQFEYDPKDGEIRPVIEFPLQDAPLTRNQLERCIKGMVQLMDECYPSLKKALETGEIDLDEDPAANALLRMLMERMGNLSPEERRRMVEALRKGGDPKGGDGGGSPTAV